MWETKFPVACTFTGYSGCDMSLVQEKQQVGIVQAITWSENTEARLFEGHIVIADVHNNARIELPLNIEIYMINEDNQLKLLTLEDISFAEGFEVEKSYAFQAKRIVVEEYHQLPVEEEI